MLQLKIPSSKVVKSTVKATLKGYRIPAGIAGVIPYIIYLLVVTIVSVFSMLLTNKLILIGAIFAVLLVFLFAPIFLGAIRWFWRATDGLKESPAAVFYYFSSRFLYKRALKCVLFLIFKFFTAFLTCLLPYFVISVISNSWIYQFLGAEVPLWVAGLALVQSFLRVVGIMAGIVVISRYYLFPALAVMDDNMLLLEAMHISVMVSRRSVTAFIGLAISFIPLALVSLLALPMFYTAPIFLAAYAIHSRYAVVNYNQNLDNYNKQDFTF